MRNLVVCGVLAGCVLGLSTPSRAQEMDDIKTYCMADIGRLCKGIEPGGVGSSNA